MVTKSNLSTQAHSQSQSQSIFSVKQHTKRAVHGISGAYITTAFDPGSERGDFKTISLLAQIEREIIKIIKKKKRKKAQIWKKVEWWTARTAGGSCQPEEYPLGPVGPHGRPGHAGSPAAREEVTSDDVGLQCLTTLCG